MNLTLAAPRRRNRGFTLIDLVISLAIVAILVRIALPNYQAYIVKSSRQAVQGELVALANLQEKIFLNSSSYTSEHDCGVHRPVDGRARTSCGVESDDFRQVEGRPLHDRRHATATTFTLTATPKAGTPQAGDGN
jgi:type IV pilus assembly protein PilE